MSARKEGPLARRVDAAVTGALQPMIDALGSTLTGELPIRGYGRVEINGGMHGAHGEEGAGKIRERFQALGTRLEAHLQTGAKVVYVAEGAMFTTEQSQRVSAILERYPQVTPSDAQQAVLTGVDHRFPDTWDQINSHLYQAGYDSFAHAEMGMVDALSQQYPDQFIFMVEGGREERIRQSQRAVRELRDDVPRQVQQGNFETALRQYRDACQLFTETQTERDQAVSEQIAQVVERIYEPDLLVVASFGSEHTRGISAGLRARGITSEVVETSGGYLESPDMVVQKAMQRGEEISNLRWMQSLIGHALFADKDLITSIFSGKEWNETVAIINIAISTHLQTEQAASDLQQSIQQRGWTQAAFELLAPEMIEREQALHTDRAIAVMVDGNDVLTDAQASTDALLGYHYGSKFIRTVITLADGTERSIVFIGPIGGDHDRILAQGVRAFRMQYPTITDFTVQDAGILMSRRHDETLELTFSGGSKSLRYNMRSAQRSRSMSSDQIRKETKAQFTEFFQRRDMPVPVEAREDSHGVWY